MAKKIVKEDGMPEALDYAKKVNDVIDATIKEQEGISAKIKADSERELAEAFRRAETISNFRPGDKNPFATEPATQDYRAESAKNDQELIRTLEALGRRRR